MTKESGGHVAYHCHGE